MSALGRGLSWVPDIAATLLTVVLILTAVSALRGQEGGPQVAVQSQTPGGPADLVEAFWIALHPGDRQIMVLTEQSGALAGTDTARAPLVFVLSQTAYPEAVDALRGLGIAQWREISVPPALGGGEGWNPRFLALRDSGVGRTEFPAALARVLAQGRADPGASTLSAPTRARVWVGRLRVAGNLAQFLLWGLCLMWLARLKRRLARQADRGI